MRKQPPVNPAQEHMRFLWVLLPYVAGKKMERYPYVASDAWPKTANLQVSLGQTSKFECYVRPLQGLERFPYADKNVALSVIITTQADHTDPGFLVDLEKEALEQWARITECGGVDLTAHGWEYAPGKNDGTMKCKHCPAVARIGVPKTKCDTCQIPTSDYAAGGKWYCLKHAQGLKTLLDSIE